MQGWELEQRRQYWNSAANMALLRLQPWMVSCFRIFALSSSMVSSAKSLFEKARNALADRDFDSAAKHAQRAKTVVWADLDIKDHGPPPANPTYSIVVVLYKRHRYLGDALSRISRYAACPDFELILVNNGNFVAEEMPLFRCEQFRWVDVGFNYGCSGGRNLGAEVARGKFVIFVDDDGLIEDFTIEKLIESVTQNDTLAVRGRVCPMSPSIPEVSHYDLGDEIVYSVPNTEGISIWRRQEFLGAGGFDTLLAGGEGLALWSRIRKSRGLGDFLYTPYAILVHDYAEDLEHFARKQAKDTPNSEYFVFAYPDVERQRRDVAIELTRRAVEGDPGNAELYHSLGNLLQSRQKADGAEAEEAYLRAIELKPSLAVAHWQLSVIIAKQGRQEEALAAAQRAVEFDREGAELHHHLGNLLQKGGRLKEAEAAQQRVIELKPDHSRAYRQLSVIFAKQGRQEEALTAAQRAVEFDREGAELHHHLGNLLQKGGRLKEAEAAQQRVIELKPDHSRAYRQLSVIFAKQGRQEEALTAAQRAVEFDREGAELHHHLGNLLQKGGRLEEAEAAHRRAIELDPDHARSYRQLSVIFAKQGRQEEALTAAQRAVECEPQDTKVHSHLGGLQERGQRNAPRTRGR